MPSLPVSSSFTHPLFQFFPIEEEEEEDCHDAKLSPTPVKLLLLYLAVFTVPGALSMCILMWPLGAWAAAANETMHVNDSTEPDAPLTSHASFHVFQLLYCFSGAVLMMCQAISACPTISKTEVLTLFISQQLVAQATYYAITATGQDDAFLAAGFLKSIGTIECFMLNNLMLILHVCFFLRKGNEPKQRKLAENAADITKEDADDDDVTVPTSQEIAMRSGDNERKTRKRNEQQHESVEGWTHRAAQLYRSVSRDSAAILGRIRAAHVPLPSTGEDSNDVALVPSTPASGGGGGDPLMAQRRVPPLASSDDVEGENDVDASQQQRRQQQQQQERECSVACDDIDEDGTSSVSARFTRTLLSWRRNRCALIALSLLTMFCGLGLYQFCVSFTSGFFNGKEKRSGMETLLLFVVFAVVVEAAGAVLKALSRVLDMIKTSPGASAEIIQEIMVCCFFSILQRSLFQHVDSTGTLVALVFVHIFQHVAIYPLRLTRWYFAFSGKVQEMMLEHCGVLGEVLFDESTLEEWRIRLNLDMMIRFCVTETATIAFVASLWFVRNGWNRDFLTFFSSSAMLSDEDFDRTIIFLIINVVVEAGLMLVVHNFFLDIARPLARLLAVDRTYAVMLVGAMAHVLADVIVIRAIIRFS